MLVCISYNFSSGPVSFLINLKEFFDEQFFYTFLRFLALHMYKLVLFFFYYTALPYLRNSPYPKIIEILVYLFSRTLKLLKIEVEFLQHKNDHCAFLNVRSGGI